MIRYLFLVLLTADPASAQTAIAPDTHFHPRCRQSRLERLFVQYPQSVPSRDVRCGSRVPLQCLVPGRRHRSGTGFCPKPNRRECSVARSLIPQKSKIRSGG
jgi:hypothetical protein